MIEIDQILDELDNSRERLLVAIEELPDEALLTPGALGEWSIADLLVNLTVWEAEVVTAVMRLDQGKKPEALQLAMSKPDEFDTRCQVENNGRDLDHVFADWQQVRVQLEEWLETLPVRYLTNPKRYKWLNGRSLWQVIQEVLIAREKRYLPYVQLFAQRWQIDPTSILPAEDVENDSPIAQPD